MGQSAPRPDSNGAKRFGRQESFDEMEEPHGIVIAACPRADAHFTFATPTIMFQGVDGRVIGKQRLHRLTRSSIGTRSSASKADHKRAIRRHVGAGFNHHFSYDNCRSFRNVRFPPLADGPEACWLEVSGALEEARAA